MTPGWRALLNRVFGHERLARLSESSCTVEMSAVGDDNRVVEIDVGSHRELWLAPNGQLFVNRDRTIRDGQLIVTGQRPATAAAFFKAKGRRPERIIVRF